jgi:hypothetical protein
MSDKQLLNEGLQEYYLSDDTIDRIFNELWYVSPGEDDNYYECWMNFKC